MEIILDISPNSHKNDMVYFKEMILAIKEVDNGKHLIRIKGQLFEKAGDNIPQDKRMWGYMTNFCEDNGYKLTASVFDKPSLDFLLIFNPCFVKIANNRDLDWLIGEIPRKIPVYKSINPRSTLMGTAYRLGNIGLDYMNRELLCISKYPAPIEEYDYADWLYDGISDHTIGLDLVKKYKPQIYECHFVLEHDDSNLDGGLWAKTPMQLKEILNA